MPQVGEIKTASKLGYKKDTGRCIWYGCSICGKERWVRYRNKRLLFKWCKSCVHMGVRQSEERKNARRGSKNALWKGGRWKSKDGYVHICLTPDNFFYSMANANNYVLEHRLVMAQHHKRPLLKWEVVHHKNGVKGDNRIENLELLPHRRFHLVDSTVKGHIGGLEAKIKRLEGRIRELES